MNNNHLPLCPYDLRERYRQKRSIPVCFPAEAGFTKKGISGQMLALDGKGVMTRFFD